MKIAKTYGAQVTLLEAVPVAVETDIARGLYQFAIVGLPDKAVEEARDRVSAAIKNSGFGSPKQKNQKVVISLSPADLKKEGAFFDLPIALSYLLAAGDALFDPEKKLFIGELSLSGELLPVRGVLPVVRAARKAGFTEAYVPEGNAREAALVEGISIYPVSDLKHLVSHLCGTKEEKLPEAPRTEISYGETHAAVDFYDIKGQEFAKRGLLIAAAGGHNVGMYGPPGTGKTLLARAFAGILPPLEKEEVFEVTSIHSVAGRLEGDLVTAAPFRAPHHTSSYVSLVGGGSVPRPGEITLAHRGVLFLDEFPEFDKRVIESLRQPLEDGEIHISRSRGSSRFPARFMLVAAMNPCPCGYYGTTVKRCVCRPGDLGKYARKLSGPIVDRIDLWLSVETVEYEKLADKAKSGLPSSEFKRNVASARERQRARFAASDRKIRMNSEMNVRDLAALEELSKGAKALLEQGAKRLSLSARGYHKMVKLARTIADLDASDAIAERHLLEAFQYRPSLERMR
ncbi:YifB family Mg chelatase-like AAA ATPase [Candidatus Parcubacteria bacterium]|nr:YifB family Mg chelatase-like AAA ATPase [Candidatus Parcubacteria bacterium]